MLFSVINFFQTLGNRLIICINEANRHTNSHPIIHIRNGEDLFRVMKTEESLDCYPGQPTYGYHI